MGTCVKMKERESMERERESSYNSPRQSHFWNNTKNTFLMLLKSFKETMLANFWSVCSWLVVFLHGQVWPRAAWRCFQVLHGVSRGARRSEYFFAYLSVSFNKHFGGVKLHESQRNIRWYLKCIRFSYFPHAAKLFHCDIGKHTYIETHWIYYVTSF